MINFDQINRIIFSVGRSDAANGVQLLGTAFALEKPGFYATASHVVGTNDDSLVLAYKELASLNDYQDTTANQIKLFPVRIVASDPFRDLVVLRSDAHLITNVKVNSSDAAPCGTHLSIFGFPHADHGRMVLTQQNTRVGARILLESGSIKSKHMVLNVQARPGQSGSPVFKSDDGTIVAVLLGSYAPAGGGGISLGGVDPHTLHQTTHAVSAEYLQKMY